MTTVLIEAGPATVTGPHPVAGDLASTAVECIDDATALVGDTVEDVDALWSDVLRAAGGSDCGRVAVVCPTWWNSDRTTRVRGAAVTAFPEADDIAVVSRRDALIPEHGTWAVVEIAEDLVMVSRSVGGPVVAVRGEGALDRVVAAVLDVLGAGDTAIVDSPREVWGAGEFVRALGERLQDNAVGVSIGSVVAPVVEEPDVVSLRRRRFGPAGLVVPVGAGLAVATLFALVAMTSHRPAVESPTVTLTEGRVAMQVPATWTAQRLSGGVGSARVQVTSSDPEVALQLTQSGLEPGYPVADALRNVLEAQPGGIFVEFNPYDRVAGRDAITYRELRPSHHVMWIILVDRGIRIAIGCQSAPARPAAIKNACDDAVRTAHADF